jgi:hypothetical protein
MVVVEGKKLACARPLQPVALAPLIVDEAWRWARAGFPALPLLVVLGLCCNLSLLLGFVLLLFFNFGHLVPNSLFLMKNVICTPLKNPSTYKFVIWSSNSVTRPKRSACFT